MSSVWPSDDALAAAPRPARERLEVAENALVRRAGRPRSRSPPPPSSWSWSIQLVFTFASRSAFSRYSLEPLGSSGQAPTRVWQTRYSSFGSAPARRELAPAARRGSPSSSAIAGERADPRAHVAAALGVVRRRREQAAREAARARGSRAWKSSTESEKRPGSPPTSFSASEPDAAVEGRVLDALRHHRPVVCWKRTTNASCPRSSSSRIARAARRAAAAAIASRSASVDVPASGLDVGAVDGQRRERALEVRHVEQRAASSLDLGLRTSSAPARASPRAATSSNGRRSPVSSAYSAVSGSSPAGSTKSAVDVVQELVAVVPSTGQSRSRSPGSRIFSTQTCSTPASRSRSR